ncbi:MAG: epimerase [Bacteroidetes bacterium B1(2017)]|nr:MAG: epimerase [Bacteroidetes bacterium B1(2017)]
MTILITGGAGFIGSNLVDLLLSQSKKVVVVDNYDNFYSKEIKVKNLENASKNNNFTFIEGDILDEELIDSIFKDYNFDIVVHLASKAGVRPSLESPKEYFDVNLIGTLNILNNMKKANVKKMIFASSSSVYGNSTEIPFVETNASDSPISPYAASKRAAELLCHTYHHLYNFDIFCLRFFTVYGPRQRPDLAISKFTKLALEGNSIPIYGDGSMRRDYTYIDDILQGITKAIEKINGFEIFNLGENTTISVNELVNLLGIILKKEVQITRLPKQPGDVNITFASLTKSKIGLEYAPKTNIEEGLRKFVSWFTKNVQN